MGKLFIMIKPNSNLCNIDCRYCFYSKNHNCIVDSNQKFMKKKACVALIKNIMFSSEGYDEIEFIFQGGEPSIIGLEFFEFFLDTVDFFNLSSKKNISYNFQTNGINIDENWASFFKNNNFLVGLSLDMFKNNHDLYRMQGNRGTFDHVMNTKKMFDNLCVDYNILSVITKNLSKNPLDAYEFIKHEGISYIQFIPCIDDNINDDNIKINPRDFFSFYSEIFKLWINDLRNNTLVHIKLFEDIYYFIKNKSVGFCGQNGTCGLQIVVESDLTVYPCDFFCFKKYQLGNLYENKLSEIILNEKHLQFFNENPHEKERLYCKKYCSLYSKCKLGCKKLFDKMYLDETGFCAFSKIYKLISENYYINDRAYNLCDQGKIVL